MDLSSLNEVLKAGYYPLILASTIHGLEIGDRMFGTDSTAIVAKLRELPLDEAVEWIVESGYMERGGC